MVKEVKQSGRTHACPRCNSTFGSSSQRSRHVRTVHEKRRDHACPHCAAAFGEASSLMKHVRTAHLAPHCAAVALVAGRGGKDEEQAAEAEGGDSEPEMVVRA